jgi:Bacterial SH3 domain
MSSKDNIIWFKQQFKADIKEAIQDTPFSINLIAAIALQETGYLWGNIRQKENVAKTLELCVGDTLDTPARSAFPRNKEALVSRENGEAMFRVAREALESIAIYNSDYNKERKRSPDKFCHGFGIFQYDIQFFLENPSFFLEKKWYEFDECLRLCIDELSRALVRSYGNNRTSLTSREMVGVAIAYNRGKVNLNFDIDDDDFYKQGYKDDEGKYYGQYIRDFLELAKSTEEKVIGKYRITARNGLNIRSGPGLEFKVIDRIPLGSRISVGKWQNDWVEVDKEGDGAIDGWVFSSYLELIN